MGKIAITLGDPAGIGAEIILKSLSELTDFSDLVLIGNRRIFKFNEDICNIYLPKNLEFIDIDADIENIIPAAENKFSGELAYKCLKKACDLVKDNYVSKISTAPLSKNALHLAGYNYSGQTEILQKELSDKDSEAQMLFVAGNLKILLLTRHVALKDIPQYITEENITNTVKIFDRELKEKFNIKTPKLVMAALNPHAGERGVLGMEEINIINPAIKKLLQSGFNIDGAYSADSLIAKAVRNYGNPDFDGYIACYHDQALPAIKILGADKVLNITIGLKALRSSPSHGTAFDIAYQNKADYRSMLNSILFLQKLNFHSNRNT